MDDDQFGNAVAIQGDTGFVRTALGRCLDGVGRCSTVSVFSRDDAGHWAEQQALRARASARFGSFGGSIAVRGDTLFVGEATRRCAEVDAYCGAVYVFHREADGMFREVQTLDSGVPGDLFGASISVDGNTAIVGAGDPDREPSRTTFGSSVVLGDSTAVVGARDRLCLGAGCGAAYVFARDSDGHWSEVQTLTPFDGAGANSFGANLAISGDAVVIGHRADRCDDGSFCGSVYVATQDDAGLFGPSAE